MVAAGDERAASAAAARVSAVAAGKRAASRVSAGAVGERACRGGRQAITGAAT